MFSNFSQKSAKKSWGGGVAEPLKFFGCACVFFISFCTTAIAVDDTGKQIIKTYFSIPSPVTDYIVSSDDGTITLPNADALSDTHRGQDNADNYRSKVYGRVFVMVTDAHFVNSKLSGVKICPIQINAAAIKAYDKDPDADNTPEGGDRRRVGRLFEKLPDGTDNQKCVWLCASGYAGSECTIAVANFNNYYGTATLSWDSVSVANNGADSPVSAVNFGAHYHNDKANTVYHDELVKMFLLAIKTVSNGAVIQPAAISVKISHEVDVGQASTKPRYKIVSSEQVFCKPGYKPNGNACTKIATNPCSGSSSGTVNFTSGNANYVYSGGLSCTYDEKNNSWCKMPSGGTTKCAVGYYGNPSAITISSSCGWNASGCARCPYDSVTGTYGTTSGAGATSQSSCYRTSRSGSYQDDVGWYAETGMCYYVP